MRKCKWAFFSLPVINLEVCGPSEGAPRLERFDSLQSILYFQLPAICYVIEQSVSGDSAQSLGSVTANLPKSALSKLRFLNTRLNGPTGTYDRQCTQSGTRQQAIHFKRFCGNTVFTSEQYLIGSLCWSGYKWCALLIFGRGVRTEHFHISKALLYLFCQRGNLCRGVIWTKLHNIKMLIPLYQGWLILEIYHPTVLSSSPNLTHWIQVIKTFGGIWILESRVLDLDSPGWPISRTRTGHACLNF